MQLVCTKCGAAISGSDIDLARGLGVCRPCGELVPLPVASQALALDDAPLVKYRPEGFRMDETSTDSSYVARIRPSRLSAIPLLFFTLFWDAFMIMWYGIALSTRVWIMAVFGLLHLGVAFVMTHKVLVKLFNSTRFRVEGGRVHCSSGPIPTRGRVDLAVDAIDSFTVGWTTTSGKNGDTVTYHAEANLAAGTKKVLRLDADDQPSVEYAVYRFNDALAAAKRRIPQGPYRD